MFEVENDCKHKCPEKVPELCLDSALNLHFTFSGTNLLLAGNNV